MFHGGVKKQLYMHHLVVNKKGFASLYALLVLQIVLAFVLLLLSSSKAVIANNKIKSDLHKQQLYAIYHIKAHILEKKEEVEHSEDDMEEENREQSEQEVLDYLGQIFITYQRDKVDVTIAHMHFCLVINEETNTISNFVYL